MAFVKAVKQVKYAKISLQGREKSGKTTTAAMLAADTAKKYHVGKPVAFLSSEPGVDYVMDIFAAEKVDLLTDRRADFVALKNSIPEAIKAGAGVLLIDSATKYWQELVKSYKAANNIKGKMKPFHYIPIKESWAEFTEQFVPAKLDIIVCGRLGFEFEELEDEEGETEIRRIGTKMKTEGDFNYETDLIIEMQKRDDLDTVNAEAIKLKGRKKLRRIFQARSVHVATVMGTRVWALNGQSFQFRSAEKYEPGMAASVGKCFAPYFDFLKSDGATGDVVQEGHSRELFAGNGDSVWLKVKQHKENTLESIKNILALVFKGQTAASKDAKIKVLEEVFGGALSWGAVEGKDITALEEGLEVLKDFRRRVEAEHPSQDDGLLSLLALSKRVADEGRAVKKEMPF